MATHALDVTVFPGGFNLPIWAGQTQGSFETRGVSVTLHLTGSSMEQLSGLIRGNWDIGMTGVDNVIAYQEGQGEAEIEGEPDLFVFMGGDNAFLRLVVQEEIERYADLRGKTLSVDALTTGFAFVLRKMLEHNGLEAGDVSFDRAGGVLQRWEMLREGKHAGTLLLTPFEIIAEKVGLRLLQRATEVLPHYQGLVGTTRRRWAEQNDAALTGYIAGYLDALDWLYERDNRDAACGLLVEKVSNMTPEIAERTYDVLLGPEGFDPVAAIDWQGMETVLALRSEYGRPRKRLADPQKYVDLAFYDRARAVR